MSVCESLGTQALEAAQLEGPGRNCPLDYRYSGKALATASAVTPAQVAANGDFHWFNADVHAFLAIEQGTQEWQRLRGNVETELARVVQPGQPDAGCGRLRIVDGPDAALNAARWGSFQRCA